MAKSNPKLKVTKPKNVFTKPLKVDYKELFTGLSKGVGHTVIGKWEELGSDTVEALSALGLATEPGELAFLLIRRSITKALFDLVGESATLFAADAKKAEDALIDELDFSNLSKDVYVDRKFLDRPSDLPLIRNVQTVLRKWFEAHGIMKSRARAIAERLPSYFVYALNQEWRRNAKSYRPLVEGLDTPFAKASDREWAWTEYSALLQRRVEEGLFDEPFSLSQIFVPLNAYYLEKAGGSESAGELGRTGVRHRRIVVSLQQELQQWLLAADLQDLIRVISGGPGSGKSSFARVFAAQLAHDENLKVLYVPLHLIDPAKDMSDEVGRFVRDEGVLLQNPLDPDSPEPQLLIIFDGLDELASQGKASAETARAFLREVERTVEKRNLQSVQLRVLISGRELVVQENESEFRRPRQILTLLPYFVPMQDARVRRHIQDAEDYSDPKKLLKKDLRHEWWKRYGALTGKGYRALPEELSRVDLDEVTAQPLLNYLVALSFTREKLSFTKGINLNSIYADLVAAVHERGYEKHRPYAPIRHMKFDDFLRVLEEVGLASWHGDGRTTTVREIEEHCRASGLGGLLDAFQEGAKAGVTKLLAAFFFRQYGQRASGDPTFVFTHKSFGEYLTGRRVVRAMDRVIRELELRTENPDAGWDERDALKHWASVCGPTAISPYLHVFLLNELKLRSTVDLARWQISLAQLFGYMLRHGIPMEHVQLGPFREMMFQARNAEEGLLVALNACACLTEQTSTVDYSGPTVLGAWFKRIQGQRTGAESSLAARCLSFLDLSGSNLDIGDFYNSDFACSNLRGVGAHYSVFGQSNLANADLRGAFFTWAKLEYSNLMRANLDGANLREANVRNANLRKANIRNADLRGADLRGPDLREANLRETDLREADLREADLREADLREAKLEGANLEGANLEGANLEEARMKGHKLKAAPLGRTRMLPEAGGT